MRLLRRDCDYRHAILLNYINKQNGQKEVSEQKEERKVLCRWAAANHGFTRNVIEKFVKDCRKSGGFAARIDAVVAQELADRAFNAVQKKLFWKSRRTRAKKLDGLHSLAG